MLCFDNVEDCSGIFSRDTVTSGSIRYIFFDSWNFLKSSLTKNFKDILRHRTTDVEVKRYCVTLLEKFGSFSHTREVLADLDMKAREEVKRLGGNPLLMKILDELLSWQRTWTVWYFKHLILEFDLWNKKNVEQI